MDDWELLEIVSQCTAITFNKWCVQVRLGEGWYTEYYEIPESGTPAVLHPSKGEALAAALERAYEEQRENL